MSNQVIALDKCPCVRLVGIVKIWWRLLAKCVLKVAGIEAEIACGKVQLCTGLEAGIDNVIYAVHQLWDENSEDEEWRYLLVDSRNASNEGNRMSMLWKVRHLWPQGPLHLQLLPSLVAVIGEGKGWRYSNVSPFPRGSDAGGSTNHGNLRITNVTPSATFTSYSP